MRATLAYYVLPQFATLSATLLRFYLPCPYGYACASRHATYTPHACRLPQDLPVSPPGLPQRSVLPTTLVPDSVVARRASRVRAPARRTWIAPGHCLRTAAYTHGSLWVHYAAACVAWTAARILRTTFLDFAPDARSTFLLDLFSAHNYLYI